MFNRLERIIGNENLNKIHTIKVLIIGLGGVGGSAVETLIRNGVENIIIVDNDTIDITNKNRQIIAIDSNINEYKTDAFENRIIDINKNTKVSKITNFINKDNIDILFNYKPDYIIDACDTISTKILIIEECLKRKIKFISSMGMGRKLDITKLKIMDLKDTSYDKIAKIIRKKIRDDNINGKIPVLSSIEQPINTNEVIGSYSPVTMCAGIMLADYVLKDVIKKE